MSDYEDCITDEDCERAYHQGIARTNRRNPARYDCPTCGTVGALSAHEKQQGYQCNRCADREEGVGF